MVAESCKEEIYRRIVMAKSDGVQIELLSQYFEGLSAPRGTRHPDVCRHLAETIESTEFLFIVSTGIDQPRIALMWVGQSKRCFGKPLNGLFCGLHV